MKHFQVVWNAVSAAWLPSCIMRHNRSTGTRTNMLKRHTSQPSAEEENVLFHFLHRDKDQIPSRSKSPVLSTDRLSCTCKRSLWLLLNLSLPLHNGLHLAANDAECDSAGRFLGPVAVLFLLVTVLRCSLPFWLNLNVFNFGSLPYS